MKQVIFPGNIPIDEKRIAFIERVIMRLSRRTNKNMTALITPYPISNAVFGEDVRGVILRYMFPCEGVISTGIISVNEKPKNTTDIIIDLFHGDGVRSISYVISNKTLPLEIDLDVKAGDKLELSINPSGTQKLVEVWASLLWTPSVNDVKAKSFLFDDIEATAVEELQD